MEEIEQVQTQQDSSSKRDRRTIKSKLLHAIKDLEDFAHSKNTNFKLTQYTSGALQTRVEALQRLYEREALALTTRVGGVVCVMAIFRQLPDASTSSLCFAHRACQLQLFALLPDEEGLGHGRVSVTVKIRRQACSFA